LKAAVQRSPNTRTRTPVGHNYDGQAYVSHAQNTVGVTSSQLHVQLQAADTSTHR